ncbi:unnamed protein product [Psylliodes chrysocephalus]|uniref:DM10 domain-containing protein n=1 Tax=Psylliodes chrysocephalus TaxID=3402493 RepID=A0A9P0CVM2_9CUCU|nr:unnamed protein product [Psylliodes chrysocephala]
MAKQIYDYTDRLNFVGEWFDYKASFLKKFVIKYYPSDNTLELFDKDVGRVFLKRTKLEELTMEDMFVGNTIRVYGRQIKITDYLDCRTQNYVGKFREKTCAILKPNIIDKFGEIISIIEHHNIMISKLRRCELTRKQALDFHANMKGNPVLPAILEFIVTGPIIVLELVGENVVQKWMDIMGPAHPIEAKKVAPNSLRAIYGKDSEATNGFHGSLTVEDAVTELEFFFSNRDDTPEPLAQFENTTCCLIKPHAIQEGKLGRIITTITNSHFKITGAHIVYLSNANADEFLEVYKGVVSDYNAFMLSYLNGPCVVLEIAGKMSETNVHDEFRKFTGPMDTDIAKQIRPNTLRAMFGVDKYKNAVHCTDLPEDTVLELEYLFRVLKDL